MSLRPFLWLPLLLVCTAPRAAELTVSAAASLSEAFGAIASGYQHAYPQTRVMLNVGASGLLLQQVARGAPVDVLAVADRQTMDQAERLDLLLPGSRAEFAKNTLVLVVPASTQRVIYDLSDLLGADFRRVAIGNPDAVPAGRYAQDALRAAGLWPRLQDRLVGTQNVRQALAYATRGEVEAAFVYRSDVHQADERVSVALEVALEPLPVYPIAILRNSNKLEQARRFLAYVRSPAGQALLQRQGFVTPTEARP